MALCSNCGREIGSKHKCPYCGHEPGDTAGPDMFFWLKGLTNPIVWIVIAIIVLVLIFI